MMVKNFVFRSVFVWQINIDSKILRRYATIIIAMRDSVRKFQNMSSAIKVLEGKSANI